MGLIASKIAPPHAEGLRRERLLDALAATRHVGFVIAPAGSGKTTLLAQLARRISAEPVAWYRAEPDDRAHATMLEHLEYALSAALPGLAGGWTDVPSAAAALADWSGERATLIVDDFHALHGSDAETALGRLLDYRPERIRVIAASRVEPGPGINLPRLWVSGHVVEVDADDLRFRSWEVERLFRDVYAEPLPPEDLAALTRRTHGWAAGLKLFHLATAGKPTADRRQMVAELTHHSRIVRQYLATNVMAELPATLRGFLRDTCVLARLTAPLCDELRHEHDSAELLAELAKRQLLTPMPGEGEGYRCHDVLRSYIQALLLEEMGERETRTRFQRAGALLERAGHLGDAAVAYCYAEAWDAASRMLNEGGGDLGSSDVLWPDHLPAGPHDDPWLHLIVARRSLAEGRLHTADLAYRRAQHPAGPVLVTDIARREHRTVASWSDPRAHAPLPWVAALQAVARGVPPAHRPQAPDDAERRLIDGVANLLGANLTAASDALAAVADDVIGRPGLTAIARLTGAIAALFNRDTLAAVALEQAADHCDKQGMAWLAHLGRAAMSMASADAADEAVAVRDRCLRFDDHIGAALAALFGGLAAIGDASAAGMLASAEATFRGLELRTLQVWALAGKALALEATGHPDARATASAAASLGRQTGAHRVLPVLRRFVAAAAEERAAADDAPHDEQAQAEDAAVTLRLLGGFALRVGARTLDMRKLKPRARAVLHLLALHAGHPVHRDVLVDALWPEREPQSALRAMHVSLSAIRRQLEDLAPDDGAALLERHGDAYAFASHPSVWVDVARFERARSAGRNAAHAHDIDTAIRQYRDALVLYRGDLLPEVGATEWIVGRREECRTAAADVAEALATLLLQREDLVGAISACERGLAIDGFRDGLWRLAATAHERRGHHAIAERVRQSYEQVLRNLGVANT